MARFPLAERVVDLRTAVDAVHARLADGVLQPARTTLSRAGERAQLSAEHTVVALAGATGAGKSTVFNLLVGADLARTSRQRPTTSLPLAAVAEHPEIAAGSAMLLEWLGVHERHELAVSPRHPDGLVLLDLPDHDSIVAEHRLRADHVTERADLLVWITNPQKYADAVLHSRYLAPLAGHGDSVVVVLNQLDRLTPDEARTCLADLERLVRADGLAARVLGTSARTGEGIAQLGSLVLRAVERREAATARLTEDIRGAARDLIAAIPAPAHDPVELESARRRLLGALGRAAGVPLVVEAVRDASLRDAVARTGWPPTRWLQRFRSDPLRTLGLRPARTSTDTADAPPAELVRTSLPTASPAVRAQVATATRDFVSAAALSGIAGERLNARAVSASSTITDALDSAVARTVRLRPARWWRAVDALQWLLLAAAVAGGAWLGILALLDYLRIPTDGLVPALPIGAVALPWPTVLLVGGIVVGLVVAGASRLASRTGANRRAERVATALEASVERVARERILGEVDAELTTLETARSAAARAAR
ncbi:GTPase family protein [Microbacterium ulmi]|uniref:GTP-binding protein HSR1 n=1 Tax=Microbacterium ulmi TaxID=179095 RepID=A0A7Y2LX52_9MICO|nr:GTPase [Microbacterium ulmi]NII71068.1 GTP-binding protein EngB required for normal cell division [Microbacterium ulmi]NNH02375.1 GTP-binding protein HSR1 [Microbacterium ulmi]